MDKRQNILEKKNNFAACVNFVSELFFIMFIQNEKYNQCIS